MTETISLYYAWLDAIRARDAFNRSVPNSEWTLQDSIRYAELDNAAGDAYLTWQAAKSGRSVTAVADGIADAIHSWCD